MAAANTQLLTLFDPHNTFGAYNTHFDNRIFKSFDIGHSCVIHLITLSTTSKQLIHFFLPDNQTALIQGTRHLFINTVFYLYCTDQQSVESMRSQFKERALFKIFTADNLLYHLRTAAIDTFHQLAKSSPSESNEHDEWMMAARQQMIDIVHEYPQQMNTQLSRETS